jgi:hypothetical protein
VFPEGTRSALLELAQFLVMGTARAIALSLSTVIRAAMRERRGDFGRTGQRCTRSAQRSMPTAACPATYVRWYISS